MAQAAKPEDAGALAEAMDWLQDNLADGPAAAKDLKARAREAGIAGATLRRAVDRLGIESTKSGYQGSWTWALPPKVLKESKDAQPETVSTFGPDEHLWGGEIQAEAEL